MTILKTLATFVLAGLAAACGSTPPVHATAPVARSQPPPPTRSATAAPAIQSQIVIAEDIRKACGIADEDAYFDFDSAALRPNATNMLQTLATCFETGPLKGRTMQLIGRCDPRGDAEYNMILGEHRAESVRHYIAGRGLAAWQMETTSRGKMDAIGYDEATWALDRRVDVMLAPPIGTERSAALRD
jgi:peptidoglycan-associated lipoprotein